MGKVKYNIHYGTNDIEQILDVIIKDKIREVTRLIKRGEVSQLTCTSNSNKEVVK